MDGAHPSGYHAAAKDNDGRTNQHDKVTNTASKLFPLVEKAFCVLLTSCSCSILFHDKQGSANYNHGQKEDVASVKKADQNGTVSHELAMMCHQ